MKKILIFIIFADNISISKLELTELIKNDNFLLKPKQIDIKLKEFTNDYLVKYDKNTNKEYLIFNYLSKNISYIYSFEYSNNEFREIKFSNYENSLIMNIHLFKNILIFSLSDRNEIYVSFDSGKIFTKNEFNNTINEIFFNERISDKIVIKDVKNNYYLTLISKGGWKLVEKENLYFAWNQIFNHYYIMKNVGNQQIIYQKTLYTEKIEYEKFKNAFLLSKLGKMYYFAFHEGSTSKLFISLEGMESKEAHFPHQYISTKYKIFRKNQEEIYIAVKHKRSTHLYIAYDNKLEFITINEHIIEDVWNQDCGIVEVFNNLPGIIMASVLEKNIKTNKISFNGGFEWVSIKIEIGDHDQCSKNYCYMKFSNKCIYDNSAINLPSYSPYLMITTGTIVSGEVEYEGLLISENSGLTWSLRKCDVKDFRVIDSDSIIAIIDHEENLLYSFDLGRTWNQIEIEYYRMILFTNYEFKLKTVLYVVGYSDHFKVWTLYNFDFSTILVNKCRFVDYTEYTPGANEYSCYNGKRNLYYKRIPIKKCLNIYNDLPDTRPSICQCQQADYNCPFQFKMIKKHCYVDSYMHYKHHKIYCEVGEQYYVAPSKSKPPYNHCILKYASYKFNKYKLCHISEYEDIITYRTEHYIHYLNIENEIKTGIFPVKTPNNKQILSYDIDILSKTLFYVTDEGLFKFFWGDEISYLNYNTQGIGNFTAKTKIKFDNIGKILYVYDETGIHISIYPFRDFSLIIEDNNINNFDIFPEMGILVYDSTISNKHIYHICTMLGEKIIEENHHENFLYGHHLLHKNSLILIFSRTEKIIDLDSLKVENKIHDPKKRITSIISNQNKYSIHETTLYRSHRFVAEMRGSLEFKVHLKTHYQNKICSLATCSHLCIISKNTPKCGCPEGLKLYDSNRCVDNEQDNIICGSNQFRCDIDKCIDISNICDSFADCLDKTDEKDCHNKLSISNCILKCDDKCINRTQICDGINDCKNMADENECNKQTFCRSPYKIKCKNSNICYSTAQRCDDFQDCPKGDDESDCTSLENIILKKTCQSRLMFTCNNKCIPIYKYCDFKSDCSDGSDEKNCDDEVKDLTYKRIGQNKIELNWVYNKYISNEFIIELYTWDNLNYKKIFKVKSTLLKLDSIELCRQYLVIVSLNGNLGRSLRFSLSDTLKPPKAVKFDPYTYNLFWYSPYKCTPYTYYVSCGYGQKEKLKEIVEIPTIKLPRYYPVCKVATCPSKFFNDSCSEFKTFKITWSNYSLVFYYSKSIEFFYFLYNNYYFLLFVKIY